MNWIVQPTGKPGTPDYCGIDICPNLCGVQVCPGQSCRAHFCGIYLNKDNNQR